MTIYDDLIFASGGGSTVKIYNSGMVVKAFEQVRSRRDGQVYVRMSEVPTNLTVTTDPALDIVNFSSDNQTDMVGTVKEFPDISGDGILKTNGQVWLKAGNIISDPVTVNKFADANDKVLKRMGHYYKTYPATQTGLPSSEFYAKDIVGDGNGNWLCFDINKRLYRSTDDGITWVLVSTLALTESFFATNGTGTWWRADTDGNVYQSLNIGTTWKLIKRPVAAAGTIAVNVFKFMDGKLYWMSNVSAVRSTSNTAPLTYGYTLPDTTNTSQAWTALTYPGNASAGVLGTGITGIVRDILAVDGYIIFVCTNTQTTLHYFTGFFNPTTGITTFKYDSGTFYGAVFSDIIYDGYKFWIHAYLYYSGNYYFGVATFTKDKFLSSRSITGSSLGSYNELSFSEDFKAVSTARRPRIFYKYGSYMRMAGDRVIKSNGTIPQTPKFADGSTALSTTYAHGMAGDTIIGIDHAGTVGRWTPYIGLIDGAYPRNGTATYLRIA